MPGRTVVIIAIAVRIWSIEKTRRPGPKCSLHLCQFVEFGPGECTCESLWKMAVLHIFSEPGPGDSALFVLLPLGLSFATNNWRFPIRFFSSTFGSTKVLKMFPVAFYTSRCIKMMRFFSPGKTRFSRFFGAANKTPFCLAKLVT